MSGYFWNYSTLVSAIHFAVVIVLFLRIISRRPATGVALAWLLLIAAAPLGGAVLYLAIGEKRIGARRARGISALQNHYQKIGDVTVAEQLTDVDWSRHDPVVPPLNRLGINRVGVPTVRGSELTLYSDTAEILTALVRDIDSARKSIQMEFYIWAEGGQADEVLEAVIRAAQRGVFCLLLVDDIGAHPWWKGKQPEQLRAAGVHLRAALPVGFIQTIVGRSDLRLHRKIVVLDGKVAWTGSMNLVDPRFFKQDAGVGEWVDAMVRLQGAVVVPLAAVQLGDWYLESDHSWEGLVGQVGLHETEPVGDADIQVVPSGPGESRDGLLQMILGLVNAARTRLTLTTPYLVPDESLLRALCNAAARGVEVRLILPEKVDSFLTRYASRSYYDDLLDAGVSIFLYRGGLLHTKSIAVDDLLCMFGTVNLDMRSIWLNYEVALFVYDGGFTRELARLQESYLADSDRLDPETWARRPATTRFLEDTLRLVSPLL